MILTIGNRELTLRFGLGFLQEMNKRNSAEFEGVSTGYGSMALLSAGYALRDPQAFIDLVRAATAHLPRKPSDIELEEYIEDLITSDKYDETFDAIFEEVKKSPLLKKAMQMKA